MIKKKNRKRKKKALKTKWLKKSVLSKDNRELVEQIVENFLKIEAPFGMYDLDETDSDNEEANDTASEVNLIISDMDASYYEIKSAVKAMCKEAGYSHPWLK